MVARTGRRSGRRPGGGSASTSGWPPEPRAGPDRVRGSDDRPGALERPNLRGQNGVQAAGRSGGGVPRPASEPAAAPIHRAEREGVVESEALIEAYRDGIEVLRQAVAGMTPEQLVACPVPGRWSTMEVVCHLADFEPIYADRRKRVIATERPLMLSAGGVAFGRSMACQELTNDEER